MGVARTPSVGSMSVKPATDFARSPFILIWEVTQACALACRHCRAEAMDRRHPGELDLEEGKRLIEATARMGTHVMIFTGGDPLQRDDLEELIRHAKAQRLRVGTIPAATGRLVRERVLALKQAGLDQLALSLDGSDAARHDTFRQVEGSFGKTIAGAAWAREVGLPLQINTCFGAWNVDDFDAIAARVEALGIVFWEVFFLVPVGRGKLLEGLTAAQCEAVFAKLYALQQRVPFIMKITEAPHYRRFVAQQAGSPSHAGEAAGAGARMRDLLARPAGPRGSMGLAPGAVNAGKGFCFVSHTGDVFPSGYLPVTAGNVRERPLEEIYRESPLFLKLRDPSLLGGRCGRCEFRQLCGGSRSRAFALTGDHLAEDPWCAYEPK